MTVKIPSKTIALTGGGSGGHITPILAVAAELKRRDSQLNLVYIGQTGDGLGDLPAQHAAIDAVYSVRAGKFRRYHGEGLRQLLDLQTLALNLRDAVYVLIGLYQSWRLLKRLQPAVIFVKGGFVGVPVGLAAARLHIPYITHDSDAIPGLANRIISRWARVHAVALPAEVYRYPPAQTVTTGIPLQASFTEVTKKLQSEYRSDLKLPAASEVLFIIGGGLGSQRLNTAIMAIVPHLLREHQQLRVLHGVGRANETDVQAGYAAELSKAELQRITVFGYASDLYKYSGAADVIITRAGATNLAEFALQAKACVIVPSPFLTAGHQLKNAQYLADKAAAVVVDEAAMQADPNRLAVQVNELLNNSEKRQLLAHNLAKFARPDATERLANILLEQAGLN